MAKEAREQLEESSKDYDFSVQQEVEKKFADAKHIIQGNVWEIIDRPATEAEKNQYFQVIGTVCFFVKTIDKEIITGSPKGEHGEVVNKLATILNFGNELLLFDDLFFRYQRLRACLENSHMSESAKKAIH